MKNWAQLKSIVYVLVVIGVIFCIVFLVKYVSIPSGPAPKEVIKPKEGYKAGTTVNVYDEAPPGFPAGVILEQKPIYHSSSVNTPDGKKQIVVSYISDKGILEVANLYLNSLTTSGWIIKTQNVSKNLSIIQATQNNKNLVVTISPGIAQNTTSSLVTFQYSL